MKKAISVVIPLLFLVSCSSGKPAGTVAASSQKSADDSAFYALELVPKEPMRKTQIRATAKGFNIADARIRWTVNGRSVDTLNPTQFVDSDVKKGDSVQAVAVVRGREVRSNVVQIINTPPEITKVKILPEIFKPGDVLSIDAEGNDIDGNDVSFLYEWTKNGEPAGKGPKMNTTVKRGDKISVKITPFDGESYGNSVVLNREIQNLPPVIVEHKEFTYNGKIYSIQIKAMDPDGDSLRYSLEASPSGMTIDPSSGLISWPVPPEFKGEVSAIAVVDDGHGGSARYNFKITIK